MNATSTDEQLVRLIMLGDQNALGTIYDRWSGTLLGNITCIVSDQKMREAILQATFWCVWNRASEFDSSKQPFPTWLFDICKQQMVDCCRSQTRSAA